LGSKGNGNLNMRDEKPPVDSGIQEPKARLPACCWLFVGVLCVSLAILGLVVDDVNGGPNEGRVAFWMVLGFIAMIGLILVFVGFTRLGRVFKMGSVSV
jgi:hypothetical protein